MASTFLFCGFLSAFLLPLVAAAKSFQEQCLSFAPQKYIQNSTLNILSFVPRGTNLTFQDNDATCARPYQVVSADLCRVALSIPTSNRSSITYELWLPSNWTGRILATGNGGVDGCVRYEDLAYGTLNGFATYGSNNGHNGTTGVSFFRNPDIVEDFAWRALHTSVISGKTLVKHFYRQRFRKSYYIGCSLGGRQGIKASQKFPQDFNGIVAGSPAVDFNNLVSWRASFFPITGSSSSPNFISPALWSVIHEEVLKQCDGIDGVMDSIIENPNLCHFNATAMLCPTDVKSKCLNAIQVEMVEKIFSPFLDGNGHLIFPAMQPGSELMAIQKLYAGAPFSYSQDWFRYVVYKNPSWDPATFIYKDSLAASSLNPFHIRTWPSLSDLEAFRNADGKMITFHGGQDNQITSFNTERFYDRLLAEAGNDSSCQLDDFYRFFRVPGMFHCSAGPGGWVIGQQGGSPANGIEFNSSVNVLAAIVDWVENRVAPTSILGTKYVNDTVNLGIKLQRNHCLYPLTSTYIGGDSTLPSSWSCK